MSDFFIYLPVTTKTDGPSLSLVLQIISIVLAFASPLIVFFLSKRVEEKNRNSNEVFLKDFELYKTALQSDIENTLKNKDLINRFATETVLRGDQKRIEIFQTLYNLYFKILYSNKTKEGCIEKESYEKLNEEILALRTEIYTNIVYLGPELGLTLLHGQIELWDEIRCIGKNYAKTGKDVDSPKTLDYIEEAEKWIMKNQKSFQTYMKYEIEQNDLDVLHKKKIETLKEFFEKKKSE